MSFGLRHIALLGLVACEACLSARRRHPVKGGGGGSRKSPLSFIVFFFAFFSEGIHCGSVNDNQQFSPEIGAVTVSGPAGGISFRRRDTSRLWWRVAQMSQTTYFYSGWMRAWGSVRETFRTRSTSLLWQSRSDVLTRMSEVRLKNPDFWCPLSIIYKWWGGFVFISHRATLILFRKSP